MTAGSSSTEGLAVITGVGGGIARALAERLAGHGGHVLGVSRDLGGWAARASLPAGFDVVAADLSTSEGIARALDRIHDVINENGERIDILVHCAGTVGALGPVYERTEDEIDTVLTLHAKAPLLLTTGLRNVLSSGARVLSISTRAAHATFPGVSMYAMAKHAQHSVVASLRLELAPEVLVASAIPGEVDTGMQADLRAPDPGVFALAEFFRQNEPNLIPIDVAVDFLVWLLTKTSDAEYPRASDWYIYDASLHARWLPPGREFPYPEPP
ncbi:MAG TPA: SDR family oxidoreductase [Solirubrobacteraceae bacterium]|nr:SDR family oxidoreductase [Solirubrobacteraceae bacterium]